MKRIVITHPGGYDRIKIEETPDLKPSEGQVVVNVEYAGLSYAEIIIRLGLYQSAKKHGYPITPGFEFSGTVKETGSGVTNLTVGQRVFGVSWFGAYATQVCVPSHQVFPVPTELTMIQAATFPAVFLTAWYAAIKLSQATQSMTALVHSAAGGVGMALTQILAAHGCTIIGVVGSSEKVSSAKNIGCREVINKSAESLWTSAERYAPKGFDLIFDSTGVETLKDDYRHLKPTGRLISYGFASMLPKSGRLNYLALATKFFRSPRFNPIHMADENKSVMAFNLSFLFDRHDILQEGMSTLLDMLNKGRIKPLPVTEFAFSAVVDAHKMLESGRSSGKLALRL